MAHCPCKKWLLQSRHFILFAWGLEWYLARRKHSVLNLGTEQRTSFAEPQFPHLESGNCGVEATVGPLASQGAVLRPAAPVTITVTALPPLLPLPFPRGPERPWSLPKILFSGLRVCCSLFAHPAQGQVSCFCLSLSPPQNSRDLILAEVSPGETLPRPPGAWHVLYIVMNRNDSKSASSFVRCL